MVSEDYKRKYEAKWAEDSQFSDELMGKVNAVLDTIQFPKKIRDNKGTSLDAKGSDLTILPVQIGVRVRRFRYVRYDEFTQDDKERRAMSCDYYFFGYATSDEKGLYSYMVWDGKQYESKRDTAEIPVAERKQNQKHSLVWFNCYRNYDIKRTCTVYATKGPIGFKKPKDPPKGRQLAFELGR